MRFHRQTTPWRVHCCPLLLLFIVFIVVIVVRPHAFCATSGPDNIRPYAFLCETTILGLNNARPHAFHTGLQYQASIDNARLHACPARLQYQAPTTPDPTLFMRHYNIRAPTISDPTIFIRDYNNVRPHTFRASRNNVRPHACRARVQYLAATMSDPTLVVRDYNIRPHAFRARLKRPVMSDPTLFVYETAISGPQ